MRFAVNILTLLTACTLAALPMRAQYVPSGPPQESPSPDNGPYVPPPDPNAPPPPDQQGGPDQQSGPDQGTPDQSASFQTFYDNLAQLGTWIQSADYGYVWQPNVNDPNWAPYTNGHWVYSDAGWTWVSDEPWGWATYHYGRWVNLDGIGWCWVPGYTWAPAWVSWRYGDGYAGWAPLPPDSFVGIDYAGDGIAFGIGFHIGGDCDSYYGIGAGCYHFVPVNYLCYSNYHGHYADRNDNFAIINHTTNVTNLNVNRNEAGSRRGNFAGVTTGGPSVDQVNAVSQTPVQRVTLTSAHQPGGGTVSNNSLALFAPRVNAGTTGQPAHVAGSLGRTTVNRGVDITRPLAVNRNLVASAATPSQVQQAQIAQSQAPVSAKVVTTATPVNSVLQTPLTTLKPIAAAAPMRTQNVTPNVQQGVATPASTRVYTPTTSQQNNPFAQQVHSSSTTTSNGSTYYHSQAVTPSRPQSSPTPAANNQNTPADSSQSSSQTQTYPPSSGNYQNSSGNSGGGNHYAPSGGGNSWNNRGGK